MSCLNCGSGATSLFRGDDGHFRKRCDSCEYVGGPYVSDYLDGDQPDAGDDSDAHTDSESGEELVTTTLTRWA